MMRFSTEHLNNVFSETRNDYDAVKNLMFDVASGREIFDSEEQRTISKAEANDKIRRVVFEILDLDFNSKPSKRDRKRAMKRHSNELFEIIEDVIDLQIAAGFRESEFFNDFVEYKNIADGDSQEFIIEDDTLLSIAKVSGGHHDFLLQRIGEGEVVNVPLSTYGAAIGADIDRYLAGQEDWATMVDKISEAFTSAIQNEIYSAVMSASDELPVQDGFVGTGTLSEDTKDAFDEIIENVCAVNESDVYILGTKTALKKISALTDVDWRADSQKEAVATLGRLGSYEGTTLIEIPQRFKDKTLAEKLVNNEVLLIMPITDDNKFVKMVDQGETEIDEITSKGEEYGRIDDIMKYEVQRSYGISVIIGRYFGVWNLA